MVPGSRREPEPPSPPLALSDLSSAALGALRTTGSYLTDLATPTVRLGVTGLSRAGKTVFITSLVRTLVAGGRMPFFTPVAEGRIVGAWLEPQPDDDIPRFAYEDHLAALGREPPDWPESTRRISELRVTLSYLPRSALRRQLGPSRLHVDIVDYPGEWLTDLALLGQSFAAWSALMLGGARDPRRSPHASEFLAFVQAQNAEARADEQVAIAGSRLFTAYLQAARRASVLGYADPTLGPGRFLLPGDLEGSPLLTFFPLDLGTAETTTRGGLAAMLERRFEAYKAKVVRPFWRDHFARLDRQVVLVDALAALDAGPAALGDLETALGDILKAFRPGAPAWLSLLAPRRIDRILFAATKADHLHQTSHDRLERLLGEIIRRAADRAEFAGAEVRSMALAALRATREAEVTRGQDRLACIVGTPLPGERIGEEVFDGRRSAAVFPGDLPDDPGALLRATANRAGDPDVRAVRFRPPRIAPDSAAGTPAPWPHVRLDRALDFLIGDRLA